MKTKVQSIESSLRRRIRQFYQSLNQRDYAKCHEMIDPRVRQRPESVTLLQYSNAAGEFLDHCGSLGLIELNIDLHLAEPNVLYDGRDFALGRTICEDAHQRRYAFSERWVREGRSWFTRSTGFVTPDLSQAAEPRNGKRRA